jgi:hypothetical protein
MFTARFLELHRRPPLGFHFARRRPDTIAIAVRWRKHAPLSRASASKRFAERLTPAQSARYLDAAPAMVLDSV